MIGTFHTIAVTNAHTNFVALGVVIILVVIIVAVVLVIIVIIIIVIGNSQPTCCSPQPRRPLAHGGPGAPIMMVRKQGCKKVRRRN